MSIARRAAGALGTGTTSVTLSQPTGTSTGDVLVALVADKATGGSSAAPTGWTRQGGAAGSGGRLQVFTAVVGQGGLTGTSWTFSGLTTTATGVIVGYTGVHNASPIDVAPSARVNASGTTGTTSITTATANALVLAAFASLSNGASWSSEAVATSPTLTEFFDQANGSAQSIALADGAKATAGSTGNSSATMSANAANAGVLIALRADPAVSEKVSKAVTHSVLSAGVKAAHVSKAATYSVLANPAKGLDVSKAATYAVLSTESRQRVSKTVTYSVLKLVPQFVSKAITYAVVAPNDLQKVSKAVAYAVVLASIGPSYPEKVSKLTTYAVVAPVLGEPQYVSKALGYSVLNTFGLQVPKLLTAAVTAPVRAANVSKLEAYALVEPPGGANLSKSVAYAVLQRPILIRQPKRLPATLDLGSMTWEQQSRLLQYEVIRELGVDEAPWQPPRTLTLRVWQSLPVLAAPVGAYVGKVSCSAVVFNVGPDHQNVSKMLATAVTSAPLGVGASKAVAYSVLSTVLPGVALSKCVGYSVIAPLHVFVGAIASKAVVYAVVY